MEHIIALLLIVGTVGALFFIPNQVKQLKNKTLTLAEYLRQHPQCKTKNGIKCAVCGSSSIKNWGVEGANDHRRIFLCNHCNTRLYRSDDW